MKKILAAAVIFVAAGLVTQKAEAQVRVNVNLGFGLPAYCPPPPPPPRRVVVYENPCPQRVYAPPVVVYRQPQQVVVVRDRDCDYRERVVYREYPGKRNGWYKNRDRDRGRDRNGYYRD